MKFFFVLSFVLQLAISERTCKINPDKRGIINIHGDGFRGVPFSEKCFTTLLEPCEGDKKNSQVKINKATMETDNVYNGTAIKTSPTGQTIFTSALFDTEWNPEKRTFKITWKDDNTKLCGLCNNFEPKNTKQFEECQP